MWTRRDCLTLASAAVATFSLTVACFYTSAVHAVDEKPPATTDVKVPALAVDGARVTAALDASKARTIVMTLTNTTPGLTTANFTAKASVVDPSSRMSRIGPPQKVVWTQDFAVELKPHETKTLSVELPQAAFVVAPTPDSQQTTAGGRPSPAMIVPGASYFSMNSSDGSQWVQALTLAGDAPASASAFVQSAPPLAKAAP